MSTELTVGIVFSLVGGLLALLGIFFFIRMRIFISKAQSVKGTVIQMVYRRTNSSSSSSGGYAPVYQYKTLNGESFVMQDSLSSNPPRFQVGQELDVLYDLENPQKAYINKWMNLYFLPVLLGLLGLIFGGIGIALVSSEIIRFSGFAPT